MHHWRMMMIFRDKWNHYIYCAANKLRGPFGHCFSTVKNTLFRAYCMPMYACQLWSKSTQTSMKPLYAAYNNAYRIMHYIPKNVSARPYQVSHCVRTFDALLRNNLYRFFIRCTSSSNFYSIASNVWCFLQIFIFPQLFNTPVWWRWSSCLWNDVEVVVWIVMLFASHQYCFCVIKGMWTMCTHQA